MARARGKDKRNWIECVACWLPGTSAVKVPPGEECQRCGERAPQAPRSTPADAVKDSSR